MALHARCVAVTAGARGDWVEKVANLLVKAGPREGGEGEGDPRRAPAEEWRRAAAAARLTFLRARPKVHCAPGDSMASSRRDAPRRLMAEPRSPALRLRPGKVILLGEHGVVYGHPALAAPLSRGVRAVAMPSRQLRGWRCPDALSAEQPQALRAGLRGARRRLPVSPRVLVTLESELPLSMGLGSSGGAVGGAARGCCWRRGAAGDAAPRCERLALEMEQEFHGTPSGVDHTTSARGQMVLFQQRAGAGGEGAAAGARWWWRWWASGAATKETVAALRERQARWPAALRAASSRRSARLVARGREGGGAGRPGVARRPDEHEPRACWRRWGCRQRADRRDGAPAAAAWGRWARS